MHEQSLVFLAGYFNKSGASGDNAKNNYYYNTVTYNGDIFKIRLKENIRNQLVDGSPYTFEGYVKAEYNGTGFYFCVERFIPVASKTNNNSSTKVDATSIETKIHMQYKKLNNIHRDRILKHSLKNLVKNKMSEDKQGVIAIVCALDNCIFDDIEHQLSSNAKKYITIIPYKIKLTKENILSTMEDIYSHNCDAICISRGGGREEDFIIFDDIDFIDKLLNKDILILSAVGHDKNKPFLENFTDDYFAVPAMLAAKINEYVSETLLINQFVSSSVEMGKEIGIHMKTEDSLKEKEEKFKKQIAKLEEENSVLKSSVTELKEQLESSPNTEESLPSVQENIVYTNLFDKPTECPTENYYQEAAISNDSKLKIAVFALVVFLIILSVLLIIH